MNENKLTILVVDDTSENIDLLNNILHDTYKIKVALNGKIALKILQANPNVDMILLDIMMPDMDGYEVCKKLKSNPITSNIPIIFITALSEDEDEHKGLKLGAVDYITKPINPAITKARIKAHFALYNQNRELERKVDIRTKELQETRLSIIRQLGRASEFKDNETGLHVIRMSHYTRLIAESIKEISLCHHEKWDGSGYPFGLSGENIPLSGRIIAIADVFDALTSERPYKKAWTVERAVTLIDETTSQHFDPKIVIHFHKVLPEILKIKEKFAETLITKES